MVIGSRESQKISPLRKIIGVIGSLLLLMIGIFTLYLSSFIIAIGNVTILQTISFFVGLMVIIIIIIYYLLKITWNKKMALKVAIILSILPIIFIIWFFSSVLMRFLRII